MKISKRWMPALVVPAVVAASLIAAPLQANAIDLPDRTASQLMTMMDGSVQGFSGTIVKTTDLGLPLLEMSSMMSADMVEEMESKIPEGYEEFVPQLIEANGITQALELIAGTHRMRIYASELGVRVQILDRMSQRDLIITETEAWAYDARNAEATYSKFDATLTPEQQAEFEAMAEGKLDELSMKAQVDVSNPEEVATYLVEQMSEFSSVTVGKDHLVAGRAAYQLIIEPKSSNSLIRSVEISIDGENGMALDLSVFATQQEAPALQIGFESISFETPAASLFSFEAPAGTTVTEVDLEKELAALQLELPEQTLTEAELELLRQEFEAEFEGVEQPQVLGDGWESVIYLPSVPADFPTDMLETELFADMITQVSGGQLLATPVLNVLLTDSGEVYIGSVTIEYLTELANR